MKNIGILLERFKGITNRSLVIRDAIKEVLENDFSVKVGKDQIKLKGKTVFVKVSGAAKSEISTQEKQILEKINCRTGEKSVEKIR